MNEGIPFLRGKDIKGKIDFDDTVYISEDVHERMKRSVLNEDFFLLTIAGTLGDVAVFKKEYPECNINQDIAKIKLTDEISYEYAVVYFQTKFANSQIRILSNGATRGHLNFSQVRSFDVIVPPLDIQNHITEIMKSAYDQKRQKDQKADDLLDSIDDYVLAELGIRMPALEEKKCFAVYANETVGRRVDPYYHSPYFKKLYSAINNHGQFSSLKNLVRELDYGLMPTQDYADSNDTGVPMIRVTNLLPDGTIDMSEVKYIPFDTPRLDLKRVEANDILMVQCGNTTGKIALVPKRFEDYTFGSFLFVIRGKREIINQHYLFAILSNRLIQEQIRHTWNIVTVRPNTSKPNVKNLLIPVPPSEIQTRIAEEVMNRKSEAAALKQEANAIVERAKREVEQILLEKEP